MKLKKESGYCQTSLGQAHFWTTGDGPCVTLLHQASQSSAEYLAIAPLLASRFRVLAIDMLGHGGSADPGHELSADEYIGATVEVLDVLGVEQTHLVGHHSGAVIALAIAADQPERVNGLVLSGLVVPTPEWLEAFTATPMTRDLPIDADGEFLARTWQVYRSMSAPKTAPEVTFDFFQQGLFARSRPYDAHLPVLSWDLDAAIDRLNQPALLLEGEYDKFVGDQDALKRRIQGSTHVKIPNGGAFMFYEQPEACAEAILHYLT